ncbi:hypothetical protein F5148DRAFT_989928 [Russula earlei]|uniref:Uncharacterized protein n=1 Tax=Russula earlei TaxID=71964 RepID=A0ACC0TS78_9AGAM|nr:hypothetical protein F5148DRAFT_989928 [Russula earlei]
MASATASHQQTPPSSSCAANSSVLSSGKPLSTLAPHLHVHHTLLLLPRLSKDLYNKKTHFLLELLQNADDNTYLDGITPTLCLQIEDRRVVFKCNEVGFSKDNVQAICDIGRSTKRHEREENPRRGFIGEKGIGFKSVFTVADQVYITSGPYSFHFDKTAPLGMITPALGSQYPPVQGWTTFHLHLAPSENGNNLGEQLHDVRPTLLLFLRKLRALSITFSGLAQRSANNIEVRRIDDDARGMVSLQRTQNGRHSAERYILVKHIVQTPVEEPGRENIEESDIVLAFPVTENCEPVTKQQEVHAFLPLRCYGFKFIVQADFITSASREDVLTDRSWNKALRGGVIEAFLLAITRFESDPTLRNVWFRYLPESISDSFFRHVEHKLLAELAGRQILRSSDGTYHRASQLLFLPSSFVDDSDAPLIPEGYLPRSQRYLSLDYDASADKQVLSRLGVCEMTGDDFLAGLASMDKANLFCLRGTAWHDAVATCLLSLPLRPLRILPLHNGSWAAAGAAHMFMFPPGVSIPDDLGLQSIAPDISHHSPRYQLFIRLGVMPPNPVQIAKKILTALGPRSVAARLVHARFFFDHRRVQNMPPAIRLRLADERGEAAQGDELYLDLPGEDGALSLRDALLPAARFLHPDYLSAYPELHSDHEDDANTVHGADNGFEDTRNEWLDWLRDNVGLNVVPRVLDGYLTPDFLDNASVLNDREILASLRLWWPRLQRHITKEGARALGAISIAGRRLDTLYLRRGALARVGDTLELPCIPVDDPEDHAWDFLEQLGVATRMNASFFLNKLLHMQAKGEKDHKVVEDIYRQLDARFDEDETLIKEAFRENPIILVSVINKEEYVWLRKTDVFWYSPPSIRSKAVICRSYPYLVNFFFHKLGIAQAPPYALVDELRMIADRYRGRPIPPEVQEHVAEILADISEAIKINVSPSFSTLPHVAVFPVNVPEGGIALRPADGFYIPDISSKYAGVFRGRVPLLDLPDSVPMARIRPLLESDIFQGKVRYVDEQVTKRSSPQGRRVLNSDLTELYSSRVEYFARLVHDRHKSDIPPEQTKILAKLHKITVVSVETINTTLSLGPCKQTKPEEVAFEELEDMFKLYVSRTGNPGSSIHLHICKALEPILEVDMMTLFSCITHPVDMVNCLFEFQGIAEIPVDDGKDRSWLQSFTEPSVPIIPTPVVPEGSPSPEPLPSSPPRSPTAVSVQDEGHFPPLGAKPSNSAHRVLSVSSSSFQQPSSNGRSRQRSFAHSSVRPSESSQYMPPPLSQHNSGPLQPVGRMNALQDMSGLATPTIPSIISNQIVPGIVAEPFWPPAPNFNLPMATEETDRIGIMGEHYVYKQLVRMLEDFGPENWTSELRNFIPGFAPFRGHAHADFTYLDSRGQLTRLWFGSEKAAAWQGRWPKYHIEVKSTRGEEDEPFHMSRIQMATVRASAFAERFQLGADMYVIVRVSRIGSPEPLFAYYLDPHRSLFSGFLQYATDVYLQRTQQV